MKGLVGLGVSTQPGAKNQEPGVPRFFVLGNRNRDLVKPRSQLPAGSSSTWSSDLFIRKLICKNPSYLLLSERDMIQPQFKHIFGQTS
jgi:hypothetical protein